MALAIQPYTPQAATPADLKARFYPNTAPTSDQLGLSAAWSDVVSSLAESINAQVEDSREKSLALTALEDALMWTNKAIFK